MIRPRLAMLISGGGTTMEAVAKACLSGELPIDVACVIASKETAGGIEKGRALGIDTVVVSPQDYCSEKGKVDQENFGRAILGVLKQFDVTLITQNGWLPWTPEIVINEYKDKIFNQHPGPLPETAGLYGRQPHAVMMYLAKEHGTSETEVVVQRVEKEFDGGPIVGRKKIAIHPGDTPESLQQRALLGEHAIQIEVLQRVIDGTIKNEKQTLSFIKSGEEEVLRAARKFAREQYPKG